MECEDLEYAAVLAGAEMLQIIAQAVEIAREREPIDNYYNGRKFKGRFAKDFEDLVKSKTRFRENFHMEYESLKEICSLLEPYLLPKRGTHPTNGITPKEKVVMVLEYFACGTLQRHIASVYRTSKQHFGVILMEVCDAITKALVAEIPAMDTEELQRISSTFNKWNFPNCAGALDGKHVAVKCPPNSGSLFFNYKGFFSIILMAAADGDYKFTYVDIGAFGSEGDAGVFQKCSLGKDLLGSKMQFPESAPPFVFIADDAFPLHSRIMKPFVPRRGTALGDEELIFNYRLSRARRCVENAFGILCSKFYCLSRKMFCSPEKAQKIVTACCYLHNFLLRTRRAQYCPPNYTDRTNELGETIRGEMHNLIPSNSLFSSELRCSHNGRHRQSASELRESLKLYFKTDAGSVEWQRRAASLG